MSTSICQYSPTHVLQHEHARNQSIDVFSLELHIDMSHTTQVGYRFSRCSAAAAYSSVRSCMTVVVLQELAPQRTNERRTRQFHLRESVSFTLRASREAERCGRAGGLWRCLNHQHTLRLPSSCCATLLLVPMAQHRTGLRCRAPLARNRDDTRRRAAELCHVTNQLRLPWIATAARSQRELRIDCCCCSCCCCSCCCCSCCCCSCCCFPLPYLQ